MGATAYGSASQAPSIAPLSDPLLPAGDQSASLFRGRRATEMMIHVGLLRHGHPVQLSPDIDECKEKKACQCPECYCKNTWGSYDCSCSGGLLYIRDHDTCIGKTAAQAKSVWAAVWVISIGLAMAAAGAYLVYKYRIRQYMDSEIRAIMAQYMPLDSQSEIPNHSTDDRA